MKSHGRVVVVVVVVGGGYRVAYGQIIGILYVSIITLSAWVRRFWMLKAGNVVSATFIK